MIWTNTTVKLKDLKPWQNNPRQSTKKQAQRILESFDKFGQVQVIAIGPDNEVYDGHQRLSALMTIHGPDYEVDARQCERQLTEAERQALVITLHAGAKGEWDWDTLANWDIDAILGNGMDTDFLKELKSDSKAMELLLKSNEPPTEDAEPQIDKAEELRVKWGVELGQMWQLGEHRIICGDCTDKAVVDRVMMGERALVFTDPPYGINIVGGDAASIGGGGITKFGKVGGGNYVKSNIYPAIVGDENTIAAQNFYSVCVDYGLADYIIFGGNYFTDFLKPSPCWLIWDKQNTGNFADVELCWTSFTKAAKKYEWLWNGLSRKGERAEELIARVHPTQKPVGLYKLIMKDFPAEIYFDGFSGSGTTIIACENLGRKCRAIEISPAYVAVAIQRWADVTGKDPVML